jgi:hypothetical protein
MARVCLFGTLKRFPKHIGNLSRKHTLLLIIRRPNQLCFDKISISMIRTLLELMDQWWEPHEYNGMSKKDEQLTPLSIVV